MEPFLYNKFPEDGRRSTSGVIHRAYAERIKACLKNPTSITDKSFHFYVKKERFELLDLPNLGLSNVLVVPSSEAAQVSTCMSIALFVIFTHT